jgi:triosephosphate isomerase
MSSKKTLIAANWKMHKTVEEAVAFVGELRDAVGSPDDQEVLLTPPFTALWAVRIAVSEAGFSLGAQNCHWENQGAFTGEISPPMLKDVGCGYVLVGHSERRHIFGETDAMAQKKVAAVFREGMTPVLCIGETLEEREAGKTFDVIARQLQEGLRAVSKSDFSRVAVAYEPVWAIGTGKTATPAQAQEVHAFIRERLASRTDKSVANEVRILYGGSVKPDNVDRLMAEPDIDGLLVGGASLNASSFSRIVRYQIRGDVT